MVPNLIQAEGYAPGAGAKMFTFAGTVIVYSTVASIIYGIIYWIMQWFKKSLVY